jgi:hypothetical protein
VGYEPISEHFKPEFRNLVKELDATIQINDC